MSSQQVVDFVRKRLTTVSTHSIFCEVTYLILRSFHVFLYPNLKSPIAFLSLSKMLSLYIISVLYTSTKDMADSISLVYFC